MLRERKRVRLKWETSWYRDQAAAMSRVTYKLDPSWRWVKRARDMECGCKCVCVFVESVFVCAWERAKPSFLRGRRSICTFASSQPVDVKRRQLNLINTRPRTVAPLDSSRIFFSSIAVKTDRRKLLANLTQKWSGFVKACKNRRQEYAHKNTYCREHTQGTRRLTKKQNWRGHTQRSTRTFLHFLAV